MVNEENYKEEKREKYIGRKLALNSIIIIFSECLHGNLQVINEGLSE
jgi:hypothetical protein